MEGAGLDDRAVEDEGDGEVEDELDRAVEDEEDNAGEEGDDVVVVDDEDGVSSTDEESRAGTSWTAVSVAMARRTACSRKTRSRSARVSEGSLRGCVRRPP